MNKNKLTEYQYEQIKILSQEAFNYMQEFIDSLNEIFINTFNEVGLITNIGKICNFKKALDTQSKICLKKIRIIIEKGEQKSVQENKNTYINRYYYNDAYNFITKPVTQQILILKLYTKKMVNRIRYPALRNEFIKCRAKIRRKLNKLEEKQNSILRDNINIL